MTCTLVAAFTVTGNASTAAGTIVPMSAVTAMTIRQHSFHPETLDRAFGEGDCRVFGFRKTQEYPQDTSRLFEAEETVSRPKDTRERVSEWKQHRCAVWLDAEWRIAIGSWKRGSAIESTQIYSHDAAILASPDPPCRAVVPLNCICEGL